MKDEPRFDWVVDSLARQLTTVRGSRLAVSPDGARAILRAGKIVEATRRWVDLEGQIEAATQSRDWGTVELLCDEREAAADAMRVSVAALNS